MTLVHSPFRDLPRPSEDAHGDEWDWGFLIPSAWQALADPSGTHPWPAMPVAAGPSETPLPGWFSPAVHLLAYSVAWPCLALGARNWAARGTSTDDSRLALVDEMLGDRRREFLAWLITSACAGSLAATVADATGTTVPRVTVEADPAWLAEAERHASTAGWGPFGGGNDPMHLAAHSSAPVDGRPDGATLVTSSGRAAVLVVDRYAGWYTSLAHLGAQLPERSDGRSWRVDVVCRPIGWLGTFRRSRVTGRWFSGPHSVHMMGWSDG